MCELVTGDVYRRPGTTQWLRVRQLLPDGMMLIEEMRFYSDMPYWSKVKRAVSHKASTLVEIKP